MSVKILLLDLLIVFFSLCWQCSQAHAESAPIEPLAMALREHRPQISERLAQKHVDWARAAVAGTNIEAEMTLGMAFRESGLNPFVVSRKQCGPEAPPKTHRARKIEAVEGGFCWRERTVMKQPGPLDTLPFFCGVMQMRSRSWEECQRYANDTAGSYRLAVAHLLGWYNDPVCNKLSGEERMTCALLGYGGGYPLIKVKDYPYPRNVRAATARLKQRAADFTNI